MLCWKYDATIQIFRLFDGGVEYENLLKQMKQGKKTVNMFKEISNFVWFTWGTTLFN